MPPSSSALRSLVFAAAFLLLVSVAGPARAMPLADLLLPGVVLDSGSLRFSNFAYAQSGDMAAAADIVVIGIVLGGDDGIAITGSLKDSAGNTAPSAASISYKVSVVGGPPPLQITGVKIEADFSVTEPGYANLNASVLNTSIDLIQLFAHNFGGGTTETNSGQKSLTPSSELNVVMENIDAFAQMGTAEISEIRQAFTVVPEPGSAILLALGLCGLAIAGRRI